MLRFLSALPAEQIARELATALGATAPPSLDGVALTDGGETDTTAPHWYELTPDHEDVLFPHDGTTPEGLRGFVYSNHDAEKQATVRAVLARLGAVEAPEHVS